MLNALLATVLVFVSIGLVLYLITLLFNALSPPLEGVWERRRLARHRGRAERSDALRAQGRVDAALAQLHKAFYLAIASNRAVASAITNHHTALLSRLIAISSDAQGGTVRLLSLAKVDRLLTERSQLQRRYCAARQDAHGQRVRELRRLLGANGRELSAALDQLFAEVRTLHRPPPYH